MNRFAAFAALAFLSVIHSRDGVGQTIRTAEEQRAYLNKLWGHFTPKEREVLGAELKIRLKTVDEKTSMIAKETEALNQKSEKKKGVFAEDIRQDIDSWQLANQKRTELGELHASRAAVQKTLMSLNHLATASIAERNSINDQKVLQLQIEAISIMAHPSYLMCADDILDKSRLQYWEKDLSTFAKQHLAVGDAVGLVQCSGRSGSSPSVCAGPTESSGAVGYSNVGTAFVVRQDSMVTNRHVVQHFAQQSDGSQWVLQPGLSARVEFPGLYDGCTKTRPTVVRTVTAVFVHPTQDIAILRFKEAGLPTALSLRPEQSVDDVVAVIGYPMRDYNVPRDTQNMVFKGPRGDVPFGVRRIQPGHVTLREQPNVWRTDASSLNGNSGSPVVRMADGTVVGIHVGGYPGGENLFIDSVEINTLLTAIP